LPLRQAEGFLRSVLSLMNVDLEMYYNESRTHQSLDGNAPTPREVEHVGQVVAQPVLGGLHHRYSRAA
jgi:hypothetical protein